MNEKKTKLTYKSPIFLLFLMVLLLGGTLRFHTLGKRSLWMDEARQVNHYYTQTIFHAMDKSASQQQPPMDVSIGYILSSIFPFSETLARFPAFIFGTLSLIIFFLLARLMMNSYLTIGMTLMLALSPELIKFSQEARPYSIYFFFFLATIYWYFKCIELHSAKNWSIFAWISFGFLMSRGMAPVTALLGLAITTLLYISVFNPNFRRKPWNHVLFKHSFRKLLKVALWFMPFFIFIAIKSKTYLTANLASTLPPNTLSIFDPALNLYTVILPNVFAAYFPLVLLLFCLAALAITVKREQNKFACWLLLFFLIEPIIHAYVFHYAVRLSLHGMAAKYLNYCIFTIFLIIGAGLDIVRKEVVCSIKKSNFASKYPGLPKLSKILTATLLALLVLYITFLNGSNLPKYYQSNKVDYRSAGAWIDNLWRPGDLVFYSSFLPIGAWEPFLYGENLYYRKEIPQLDWQNILRHINDNPTDKPKLFFVFHGFITKEHFPVNFKLKNFYGLTVGLLDQAITSPEKLKIIVDGLIPHMPKNSSRAKMHLLKAQLLCQSAPILAQQELHKARQYYANQNLSTYCPQITKSL